jgi:hypothetical protein
VSTLPTPAAAMAKQLVTQALERLRSIDVSLTRLVELSQGPRENLFAAGSVPFGGTVGVSPSTCSVNPPLGMPPGVVLAANPHRRGLNIQNLSAAGGPNLTIGLGLTAPQPGTGWVLAPGASWDGRVSGALWPGSVSVVASAAGCVFSGGEIMGRNETRRRQGNLPI